MKDNLMTAVLMKDLAGRSRISSCRQYFMTAHIASRSGSGRSPGTLFDGIICLQLQIWKILDTKL
jgi:hypothetical protein